MRLRNVTPVDVDCPFLYGVRVLKHPGVKGSHCPLVYAFIGISHGSLGEDGSMGYGVRLNVALMRAAPVTR